MYTDSMNFIGYNEQAIHLESRISGIRNINDETSIIRVMINEDKLLEYREGDTVNCEYHTSNKMC